MIQGSKLRMSVMKRGMAPGWKEQIWGPMPALDSRITLSGLKGLRKAG